MIHTQPRVQRNVQKKIRAIAELFFAQWIKSKLIRKSVVHVRAGIWRGKGRIYWQNNYDKARISRIFLGFYGGTTRDGSFGYHVLQAVLQWIVSPVYKSKKNQGNSTVVWFTRNQSIMYFDFIKMEVSTVVSEEMRVNLLKARSLDLFSYFQTPNFYFHETRNGLYIKREPLYELPCIGLQSGDQQHESVRQITGNYVQYIREKSKDPNPSMFEPYFDEVVACLEPPERASMETQRINFMDFVSSARMVESHLDFNVANFLGGGNDPLILLDISGAGVVLPATYDANNLLLNEILVRRSNQLLYSVLDSPNMLGYKDLLQETLGRSSNHDFNCSLFANFILRHSRYVAIPLGVKWSPEWVCHSWKMMKNCVTAWPFDQEKNIN